MHIWADAVWFGRGWAAYAAGIAVLCMGALIMAVCYGYFKEQNEIMEQAAGQIMEYISGNKDARIECYDEYPADYSVFRKSMASSGGNGGHHCCVCGGLCGCGSIRSCKTYPKYGDYGYDQ